MKLTKGQRQIKKREGTPRRARNSLSRKKFLDRLNKGLSIFIANGKFKDIGRGDECRRLHYVKWRTGPNDGAEFIDITKKYSEWDYETHVALSDMNVMRNFYNRNFVFRTQRAAEQYLAERI